MSLKTSLQQKSSPALNAEAAAWLARLHGPNRTNKVEQGFRRWLAADSAHARAFEAVTETWDKSIGLQRRPLERAARVAPRGFRLNMARVALASAAVTAVAVVGITLYMRDGALTTTVGEQRVLTLEDGSQVHLNTDTRAVVEYSAAQRRIRLVRGEALFDVTRQPGRPFIVAAGDQQILAVGTSFVVRRDEKRVAVTLVEGRVAVSSSAGTGVSMRKNQMLAPGERLTFAGSAPRLDRPVLDKLTAWRRGQVAFDNTPLTEAIAEINRYSNTHVRIDDPRAAGIRISGIFRAGDYEYFAQAVAKTYGLRVIEGDSELRLVRSAGPR